MAHTPEMRIAVRGAYVFERLPLPQAAAKFHIPESTAVRWKRAAKANGDDWDAARQVATMSDSGMAGLVKQIQHEFLTQYESVFDQLKTDQTMTPPQRVAALTSIADALVKMLGAIGRFSPEISRRAVALEVVKSLSDFIRDEFPQHLPAFGEVLEPFGQILAEQYDR